MDQTVYIVIKGGDTLEGGSSSADVAKSMAASIRKLTKDSVEIRPVVLTEPDLPAVESGPTERTPQLWGRSD